MKKSLVALAALSAIAGAAQAQSSVTLYGIVDAAVRISDNEGAGKDNVTRMVGGGLSQSRWGMTINEDLGGGLRAVANMEQRFTSDDGALANVAQWSQVWVGLQSSTLGRVTLGRQYSVIFDVVTSTYPSFKFSPYIETFKHETVFMGNGGTNASAAATNYYARFPNSVKYTLATGGLLLAAQVSAGEGSPDVAKSMGLAGRYTFGAFALGGGYIQTEAINGAKADNYNIGGSFTSGPFYANVAYYKNEWDTGYPVTQIPTLLLGTGLTVPLPTIAGQTKERELTTAGVTFNITPALLIGGQYWYIEQSNVAGVNTGKIDSFAFLVDYAFSKRTDAYAVVDYAKLKGGMIINGTQAAVGGPADDRTSFMVGVRHRF